MGVKIDLKASEGKWYVYNKKLGIDFHIRPYSVAAIRIRNVVDEDFLENPNEEALKKKIKKEVDKEMDSGYWNQFDYCLTDWRGIDDPCNAKYKKEVFNIYTDAREFVFDKANKAGKALFVKSKN